MQIALLPLRCFGPRLRESTAPSCSFPLKARLKAPACSYTSPRSGCQLGSFGKNRFSLEKGFGGNLPWWPGDKTKRISAPEQRRSRCMTTCGFVWGWRVARADSSRAWKDGDTDTAPQGTAAGGGELGAATCCTCPAAACLLLLCFLASGGGDTSPVSSGCELRPWGFFPSRPCSKEKCSFCLPAVRFPPASSQLLLALEPLHVAGRSCPSSQTRAGRAAAGH